VKISEDGGKIDIYSDCPACGEIKVDGEIFAERIEGESFAERIEEKYDYVKIFLIIFMIILGGMSAFLYNRVGEKNLEIDAILAIAQENYSNLNESYRSLESDYLSLLNTSAALEGYYSDLQDMFSSIRGEYSILEDSYSNLTQENADLLGDYFALLGDKEDLERELDELLTFSKDAVLDNMTVEILAGGNVTLIYDIEYAGYVEVNFSSSVDILFWVGGSGTEGTYYARYPDYPNTAFNGTFTIPVIETAYLYIGNPNDELAATVSFTVRYIY
jgi:hypothetical protein